LVSLTGVSGANPVVMTSERVFKHPNPVKEGLCLRISIFQVFNLFNTLEFMVEGKGVNRA
jgi:hypothetical protein